MLEAIRSSMPVPGDSKFEILGHMTIMGKGCEGKLMTSDFFCQKYISFECAFYFASFQQDSEIFRIDIILFL